MKNKDIYGIPISQGMLLLNVQAFHVFVFFDSRTLFEDISKIKSSFFSLLIAYVSIYEYSSINTATVYLLYRLNWRSTTYAPAEETLKRGNRRWNGFFHTFSTPASHPSSGNYLLYNLKWSLKYALRHLNVLSIKLDV